jgi:hypothetical protein
VRLLKTLGKYAFSVLGGFAVRLDTALMSTFSLPCALRGLCCPEVFAVRFLHSFSCLHYLPCSFVPSDGKDMRTAKMRCTAVPFFP